MKKRIAFIIFIISVCAMFPLQTYANGPVPPRNMVCEVLNPPPNAVFVDLLIQISEQNSEYVPYNGGNGRKFQIGEHSEIVSYNSDGFQSFAFHFADAALEGVIEESADTV